MGRDLFAFFVLTGILANSLQRGSLAIPATAMLITFCWAVWLRERRARVRKDFINQLKSYRSELRRGGTVVVDGLLVRYDTEVTSYTMSIGALITSINISSHYKIAREENHPEAIFYSIVSLLLGWWGFPEGPLLTIHLVRQNASGGEKIPVALLIDRILFERAPELIPAPQRKVFEVVPLAQPSTGAGSASDGKIQDRSTDFSGKSLEQRLDEFYAPKTTGQEFVEKAKRKLEDSLSIHRERIRRKKQNNGR